MLYAFSRPAPKTSSNITAFLLLSISYTSNPPPGSSAMGAYRTGTSFPDTSGRPLSSSCAHLRLNPARALALRYREDAGIIYRTRSPYLRVVSQRRTYSPADPAVMNYLAPTPSTPMATALVWLLVAMLFSIRPTPALSGSTDLSSLVANCPGPPWRRTSPGSPLRLPRLLDFFR